MLYAVNVSFLTMVKVTTSTTSSNFIQLQELANEILKNASIWFHSRTFIESRKTQHIIFSMRNVLSTSVNVGFTYRLFNY